MKRLLFAASLAALIVAGSPVAAQDYQAAFVAQLTQQGFQKIQVSRTFLGRVRLFATSPKYTREIIFNPLTGEILRDYVVEIGAVRAAPLLSSTGGGTSSLSDDDDDDDRTTSTSTWDDDDDDRDDDRDDDDDDRDDDRDDDDRDDDDGDDD